MNLKIARLTILDTWSTQSNTQEPEAKDVLTWLKLQDMNVEMIELRGKAKRFFPQRWKPKNQTIQSLGVQRERETINAQVWSFLGRGGARKLGIFSPAIFFGCDFWEFW